MQSTQAVRRFVSGRLLATREGTILLGVGAAALAAIVILIYVNQYRHSLNEGAAPVSVLVARSLIETGTPGDSVASSKPPRFQVSSVPKDDAKANAITDPATLKGSVAAHDIYPGQQLTTLDFTPGVSTLGTQLTGNQRAISIPVDTTHGLIGQVQPGDHVDVMASFDGVVKSLYQDVYVIAPPTTTNGGLGGGNSGNMILRVRPGQAAKLAYVSDNGKLWIILRPRAGAPTAKAHAVTSFNVLAGNGR